MAEFGDIQTTGVNLILGSRGVKLDERGRISFVDPEILQALVSGRPAGAAEQAAEGNTIQCACNNYQCGGHAAAGIEAVRPGP